MAVAFSAFGVWQPEAAVMIAGMVAILSAPLGLVAIVAWATT
jgi:hypothetical protein